MARRKHLAREALADIFWSIATLQSALRRAGRADVAQRLNSTTRLQIGDLRSSLLASELFPRVTHFYAYNTLFGLDLDTSIAQHIARHARPGVRIGLHNFLPTAWNRERFRVVAEHPRNSITWTPFTVLETI